MDKLRKQYLNENEKYISNLKIAIDHIEYYSNILINYNIDIKNKPWYINTYEIYIPQAIDYYNNCLNINFDYDYANNIWIRSNFKSFLSEVEKFIKFVVKTIFNIKKNISFFNSINQIDIIIEKYKDILNQNLIDQLYLIKVNINIWRENYNENKHDENKMDDNFFIKDNSGFAIDYDILVYISDFLYQIISPSLEVLFIILKKC